MPDMHTAPARHPIVAALARRRIPLGFVFGAIALWLAEPTLRSIAIGMGIALVGEALRIWAAGHLDKAREVTKSGPYRWTRHPLYLGSSIMGIGFGVASNSLTVTLLVATYLAATIGSAVRTEDAWLRARFGGEYEAYRRGRVDGASRAFSLRRALENREYRAFTGLLIVAALLLVKAAR